MYEAPKSIQSSKVSISFLILQEFWGSLQLLFQHLLPKNAESVLWLEDRTPAAKLQSSQNCKQRFERSLKAFSIIFITSTSHPIDLSITRLCHWRKSPRNANGFHQPRSSRWQGHCFCSRTKTYFAKVWKGWYADMLPMDQWTNYGNIWKHCIWSWVNMKSGKSGSLPQYHFGRMQVLQSTSISTKQTFSITQLNGKVQALARRHCASQKTVKSCSRPPWNPTELRTGKSKGI